MKFLCDRCKTRYSIGDDRVRGKILKIRCKNCANVITVREGMDAGDDAAPGERSRHPTTMAPAIQESKPASSLNAAFSAQLAKPPPALEEEWYVSIDGDQSGPFSLAEAQRWVAGKAFEADLHCWSEGFDDWLPVDKVSHFRGLRKKPELPKAPPPMPRAQPRAPLAAAPQVPQPVEEEPKPLFAATMASLEKSASTTLPPISASPSPLAGSPPMKTNGAGAAAPPIPAAAKQSGRVPAIPAGAKASSSVPAIPSVVGKAGSAPNAKNGSVPAAIPGKGTGPMRPGTVQGVGTPSPGAAALAAVFDSSESGDSMTAVGAPPFNDDLETIGEPAVANKRAFEYEAKRPVKPEPKPAAKPAPLSLDSLAGNHSDGSVEDDNLDIGEVSRVVNLKDLVKPPADARRNSRAPVAGQPGQVGRATGPVGRVTGPVNRVTASVAKLSPEEVGTPLGAPNALLGTDFAGAGESVVAPAHVEQTHRRGLFMLIGVAGLLLIGVVVAVVLMVSSSDDTPMGLGHSTAFNTDRPEDIGHPRNPGDTTGPATGSGGVKKIVTSHWPTIRPQGPTQEEPTDPNLKKLGADEIEDMAAKQGEGTKFCYIRAQKGALGLEMLDLKKISVTLTVDKTGAVTDVQLSEHGKDTFGNCLIARIKGWKFRVSPGGTFRIALAFSNG